jgi:hypothetical protein
MYDSFESSTFVPTAITKAPAALSMPNALFVPVQQRTSSRSQQYFPQQTRTSQNTSPTQRTHSQQNFTNPSSTKKAAALPSVDPRKRSSDIEDKKSNKKQKEKHTEEPSKKETSHSHSKSILAQLLEEPKPKARRRDLTNRPVVPKKETPVTKTNEPKSEGKAEKKKQEEKELKKEKEEEEEEEEGGTSSNSILLQSCNRNSNTTS